jgi:hypothetical protein
MYCRGGCGCCTAEEAVIDVLPRRLWLLYDECRSSLMHGGHFIITTLTCKSFITGLLQVVKIALADCAAIPFSKLSVYCIIGSGIDICSVGLCARN